MKEGLKSIRTKKRLCVEKFTLPYLTSPQARAPLKVSSTLAHIHPQQQTHLSHILNTPSRTDRYSVREGSVRAVTPWNTRTLPYAISAAMFGSGGRRRAASPPPPRPRTTAHPRALGLALVMPWGFCRLDVETRGSPPLVTPPCVCGEVYRVGSAARQRTGALSSSDRRRGAGAGLTHPGDMATADRLDGAPPPCRALLRAVAEER